MSFIKYSKWNGVDWESLSLEDLMDRLSDFLMQSGFDDPYFMYGNEQDTSLDALREAIMNALLNEGLLTPEELDQFYDEQGNLKI
jgi:Ca-activated chloride channel homolog